MYNQFKNKGFEENSLVKVKKEDFESQAKEQGIFHHEKFYQSEFFNMNFMINTEIINGV
jgi:hypothetical protein